MSSVGHSAIPKFWVNVFIQYWFKALPIQQVTYYLNEKVRDVSPNIIVDSCGYSPDSDLWEMMDVLTLSKYLKHSRKQSESHARQKNKIAYLVMFCASGGLCPTSHTVK